MTQDHHEDRYWRKRREELQRQEQADAFNLACCRRRQEELNAEHAERIKIFGYENVMGRPYDGGLGAGSRNG